MSNEAEKKFRIFAVYIVAAFSISAFFWKLSDVVKIKMLSDIYVGTNSWTHAYFHPDTGALLNYLFLCVGMGVTGLVAYILFPRYSGKIESWIESNQRCVPGAVYGLFLTIVIVLSFKLSMVLAIALLAVFCMLLLLSRITEDVWRKCSYILIGLLFIAVVAEPLRMVLGHSNLFNEYPEISSSTNIDGKYVRNLDFLSEMPDIVRELKAKRPDVEGLDILTATNPWRLRVWGEAFSSAGSGLNYEKLLSLKSFVKNNNLEYIHQLMGRGQINHISHILCPINEYIAGKSIKDIYIQYGIGNTLLFKWGMDLFGGVSIENYYKCYFYYILYYAVFLGMLIYIFRDPVYVFIGFSAVAVMHFSYFYVAFILAPGIIPTIHFLDAPLLVTLAAYFRRKERWPLLIISGSIVMTAMFINIQFGGMLALAWISTLAVYGFENGTGLRRSLWLMLPLLAAALALHFTRAVSGGHSTGIISQFFSGFFSWPPKPVVITATMAYISLSYWFLLAIRDNRGEAKYLYLFTFVYVQGLFLYFYWSGLLNHIQIVFPFIALQALFAYKIISRKEVLDSWPLPELSAGMKTMVLSLSFIFSMASVLTFYAGPMGYMVVSNNFRNHRTYDWQFDRAHLISTIDPAPFYKSLAIISKYSKDEKGICLISKYDNILAFLSGRYSILPHFELSWYLLTDKAEAEALAAIRSASPEYLYVDSDINAPVSDPWEHVYSSPLAKDERPARAGRLTVLRELFVAVSNEYRLIDSSGLISVYKKI